MDKKTGWYGEGAVPPTDCLFCHASVTVGGTAPPLYHSSEKSCCLNSLNSLNSKCTDNTYNSYNIDNKDAAV